jgi:hypothetical protein
LSGVTPDGYTIAGQPAVIKVYSAARPQPRCVFADVLTRQAREPRPGLALPYRVRSGGRVIARGKVPANKLRRVYMPVAFEGGPSSEFTIETSGTIDTINGKYGLQVGNYETLPTACPSG